jgi:3-hydroxybutyryl-CoA dehydrogenase
VTQTRPVAPTRSVGACVIGGGTMGRGIAVVALEAGYTTTLTDVDKAAADEARTAVARLLERRGNAERLDALTVTTDLAAAVTNSEVVIEAVPEIVDLKVRVLGQIASAASDGTLVATNTSTISVTRLAESYPRPERLIGLHFFNPAHRMQLVEVVKGERTSEETVRDALQVVARLEKEPIVVADTPGFVTSRLGVLLGTEAMRLYEEGVASAEDIDKAMRLGFGHPMGPLQLADLVGLDARLNNVRSLYEQLGFERYRPPEILERLVAEGKLGRKSGSGFYEYDQPK